MYNITIPYNSATDPLYNLGKIAGIVGLKLYTNRNRRGAAKEAQNQKAEELTNISQQMQNNMQNTYNRYDNTKTAALSDIDKASQAYNGNQSQANWDNLVATGKKYDPSFNSSSADAMTNLRNSIYSGSAGYLQPYRKAAEDAATTVNPSVDFSNGNWGTNSYNIAKANTDYYGNFKDYNQGKAINGTGDNKYKNLWNYIAQNQNNNVSGVLGTQQQAANTSTLPQDQQIQIDPSSPLSNYYDPTKLSLYVKQ